MYVTGSDPALKNRHTQERIHHCMAKITPEAQQLVSSSHLGNTITVYGPHTVATIIGGLFLATFGIAWFLVVGTLMGSPLVPAGLLPFPSPAATQPPPTPDTIPVIFSVVFPLFGLIFVLIGLYLIARAIRNRDSRVVVCTAGLAYLTTTIADTIRWEQVLTVTHRMDVTTHVHQQSNGGSTASTSVRHRYTIHCHDGRKFLLDSHLLGRKVQELAETIEVQRARYQNQIPGTRYS